MGSGSRGVGVGVKLLIGAGALAYGVKEATYTGKGQDILLEPDQFIGEPFTDVYLDRSLFHRSCR